MWANQEKGRMVSYLEIEEKSPSKPVDKVRDIKSIDGRVAVLCLSTWFFGYTLTETSLITPIIYYQTYGIKMTYEYYVGPCFGLIPLGAALGVIIAHFTMTRASRKQYLIILNIFSLFFSACLQIGNTPCLFIFRLLQGVTCGMYMNFIPAYINELTPKELGARYGVYPQISVVLGVLVAFTVGMIITNSFGFQSLPNVSLQELDLIVQPWKTELFWRVMFGISCLPSLIQLFFLVIGYIPESPYSLIIKNRRDEARDVLSLYYKEEFVTKILEEKDKLYAKTEAQEEEESRVVWTKKGIYLGFQLSIFQVLTGIASYVTQAGHVISVALQEPIFGLYTPILITIAQLIGTFISIPMLKYIEWRYLTIIGGFALVFWQTLSGLFFYLHQNSESFRPFSMTLCMVVIMGFMFTFGITVGSSVWPYISCTMSSRPILYAQILNWLLAGCSIMAFSFNVDSKGSPWIIIWVYTGITLVLTVLNCIFMVDIKGLSIRKVQIKLAED